MRRGILSDIEVRRHCAEHLPIPLNKIDRVLPKQVPGFRLSRPSTMQNHMKSMRQYMGIDMREVYMDSLRGKTMPVEPRRESVAARDAPPVVPQPPSPVITGPQTGAEARTRYEALTKRQKRYLYQTLEQMVGLSAPTTGQSKAEMIESFVDDLVAQNNLPDLGPFFQTAEMI